MQRRVIARYTRAISKSLQSECTFGSEWSYEKVATDPGSYYYSLPQGMFAKENHSPVEVDVNCRPSRSAHSCLRHIKCVSTGSENMAARTSTHYKMASCTMSRSNFGLRQAKRGGQKHVQAEPSGESQNATTHGSAGTSRNFPHQPSVWGAMGPACSGDGGNRWLARSSCRRGEVCYLQHLLSSPLCVCKHTEKNIMILVFFTARHYCKY